MARTVTSSRPRTELLESRLLFAVDVFYVNDDAAPGGNGLTPQTAYQTLQQALNNNATGPGDTIYVMEGTYRQQAGVQQNRHGDATGYLTITAYPGDDAPVFKGSDLVTGWTHYAGDVWMKTGWTTNSQQVFDDGTPLQQISRPPGTLFDPNTNHPYDRLPTVAEGTTVADMVPGSFFYDATAQTLYVQLADGSNPNASQMEASVRNRIFFSEATRGYIKIDGLIFEHGNASSVREQDALVTLGNNSIFQNSIARYGDLAGLSMADTYNVTVINSQFINNGQMGILGPGTDNYVISGNVINGNNYRGFYEFWHAGGIKVTSGAYGLIENNELGGNKGSGIWMDYANSNNTTTIRNNYLHDNGPKEAAIFIEASKNALIYNNVLVDNNRRGVYTAGSNNTKIFNNTIIGQKGISAIEVGDGHGANSTFTSIRNNIISGGTSTRDIFIGLGSGNTSNYNNIYRSGGAVFNYNGSAKTFAQWQALGYDLNSTTANPNFATSSGASYTLSYTSPGKDTGVTLTDVTVDYAGVSRPQGAGYDMGAYERVSTLSDGLAGHWHLDENTGNSSADASGNGNTLIFPASKPDWTTGYQGAGLSFNGSNDYVSAADSASLDVSTGVSLGGWFYHNSTGGTTGNAGLGKEGSYNLMPLGQNTAASKWSFSFTDTLGNIRTVTTTNTVSNDAWHYIVGTYDGTMLQIYVDGVAAATAVSTSGTVANSIHPFIVGRRGGTGYYYVGKLDELRLYNRGLTASEVADLYASNGMALMMTAGKKAKGKPAAPVQRQTDVFSDKLVEDTNQNQKRKLIASL